MALWDLLPAYQIIASGLAVAAAALSIGVYSRDKDQAFFAGKVQAIPRVPGARATIIATQYGVPTFVGLSLVSRSPWLLVVMQSRALIGAGLVVGALGVGIFLSAKHALGTNYTPCYESYLPKGLTTTGVYKLIRHPIYTANLLLVLGGLLLSGSVYIAVIFVALFRLYWLSARQEEKALAAAFPSYQVYMGGTGRFLPPLPVTARKLRS